MYVAAKVSLETPEDDALSLLRIQFSPSLFLSLSLPIGR